MKIKMNRLVIVLIFTMISASSAAINARSNISDLNINNIKSSLPDGIHLPAELEGVTLPSVEEAMDIFKKKCINVSGSDAAYEQASQASTELFECIQGLVNLTALQEEIETAKPNGNLDTVFNKYCNKRNEAIACAESFATSVDPCLTQEEKDQKKVYINITKSLVEFICHDNGNQIALFIAEEGPECFESQQDALRDCVNATLGKYFNEGMPSVDNLPSLVIKEENCKDMDKLEKCVVKQLETCRESTPANLVESMFRFIRKETPCSKFRKTGHKENSGDMSKISINVLIGTWVMAIIAKFMVSYQ